MWQEDHWYHSARVGLFLHWGMNTGNARWAEHVPLYRDVREMEDAANAAGFSVTHWIDAAVKMRADFATLATFHSCLGYLKAWRSNIPGTPTTKRDLLGELLEAAKAKGIRVLVYITGDPGSHSFFPDHPWIDDSFGTDLRDTHTWQTHYCKQVIRELIANYPDVAGFWFDGWNHAGACEEVFGDIHQCNPDLVTIRNDFHDMPFPHEDIMSIENFGKRFDPPYDYPSAAWLAPGGKECCYNIPTLSDWFLSDPPGQYDSALERRRLASILINGWTAHIGLGSDIGGRFPGALSAYIDDMADFLAGAGAALLGVQLGELPMGMWQSGAYGATARRDALHYVHLWQMPEAGMLTLPDAGLDFAFAATVPGNMPLAIEQKEGAVLLSIEDSGGFEYPIVALSAKNSRRMPLMPLAAHGMPLPCASVLDLGCEAMISGILLIEDENSAVTSGGWAAKENNRLKRYRIEVSVDAKAYRMVQSGELPGGRGTKQVNFPPTPARYVKLCFLSAHDTSGAYVVRFEHAGWTRVDEPSLPMLAQEAWAVGDGYIRCGERQWSVEHRARRAVFGAMTALLDDAGRVFGVNLHNCSSYIIRNRVHDIYIGMDGALYAVHAPERGSLRIASACALLAR